MVVYAARDPDDIMLLANRLTTALTTKLDDDLHPKSYNLLMMLEHHLHAGI